jgi:hypothetical protein
MALCQACARFDLRTFDSRDNLTRGIPLLAVADGAKSGCDFCSFLMDTFKDNFPEETREATLADWLHLTPHFKPPPADTRSGLGLVAINFALGSFSSPGLAQIQLRTVADPGKPRVIQKKHFP